MSAINSKFGTRTVSQVALLIAFGTLGMLSPVPGVDDQSTQGPDAGTCIDPNGKPRPCDILFPPPGKVR